MSALPGMRERTILMGGFSKAYAMTGWRVGYACAPAGILDGIVKVHQYGIMSASTTAQDAALVALQTADADVEAMRAEYDRRRRLLVDGLNALGLETFEPRGAFYAFPRITSTGMDDETFVERLIDRGARGGRAGERVRAVRRRPRPDVLRDELREARGGAGPDRPVRRPPIGDSAERVTPCGLTRTACRARRRGRAGAERRLLAWPGTWQHRRP